MLYGRVEYDPSSARLVTKARNMASRESDAATVFEALACYTEESNTIQGA
jgi:hypothetical protein